MVDPLSDVLRSVRLAGGVFLDARFTAPWCVTTRLTAADCRPFLTAPAAAVIAYHYVAAGRVVVAAEGEAPVEAEAGEIILLPRNDAHLLASAPGLAPVDAHALIRPAADGGGGLARIRHGGGGAATHLVCGFLGSEEAQDPLLAALPRVLRLDVRRGTAQGWIAASMRHAAGELVAGGAAASGALARLSELLFVEAVRRWAAELPEDDGGGGGGWLRGLRDPQVGRALALIHRDAGAPLSVDALARAVALSRSAFVARFTALVGVPPMRYLTAWRLRAARRRLRETAEGAARIAHAVGYASEEAFSRAFKREFGVSPARWREGPGRG